MQLFNLVYIKHTYQYTNTHLLWLNPSTYSETYTNRSLKAYFQYV